MHHSVRSLSGLLTDGEVHLCNSMSESTNQEQPRMTKNFFGSGRDRTIPVGHVYLTPPYPT
jgi:hypothetical protein